MTTTTTIDSARLLAAANALEADMVRFLRDLVAIPGESSHEGPVIQRIKQEMERVGFDEVRIDGMGNILGRIGSGKHVIMMDAHTDTVGVGDPKEWAWDPYQGKVEDGFIYGRGSSDQRGGMASMVYAGKMIKDLGLDGDYTLWIVGSVQEEDCDGLPWVYILKEDGIRPECVVLTEPTNLRVYRGHRGRMEIEVHLRGRSCHASAPERGDNPIYKIVPLIAQIEELNTRLRDDAFLGKGTIAVTEIRSMSPSLCAVPGACSIHLDRRLTAGETLESAVAEVKALPAAQGAEVEVLELRHAQLYRPHVSDAEVLSHVGARRRPCAGALGRRGVSHAPQRRSSCGQVGLQHQRRRLHGNYGRANHRLRSRRRRRRA